MNKIKFSSGGQPLFLEDVKLLQDNQEEIIRSLLYALCKEHNVLLQGGEFAEVDGGNIITGGKAFIGGDIVVWEDLPIDESLFEGDLYLCVKEVEEDEREFGDGFNRNCRVNKVVYLSNTTSGAVGYINLWNTKDFAEVLDGVLGHSSSPVSWYKAQINEELIYNGYNIEIYYLPISDTVQLKLKMSSENAAWGNNVKGVICSWPGEQIAQQLQGKYSPVIFVGGDGHVYSDIIEWSRDGTELCLLNADGGEVKHTPYGYIEQQFIIY